MGAGPDESFLIPVPGLADNRALGVTAGYFAAPASDLHTIFEPVILEITKLVSEQVSSMANPPQTLLLVGGFGASDYLKESLKMALGKGVEVMRPRGAWRAVAQGAVMKGLEMAGVRTEERRELKRYYGTEWVSKYDEKLHTSIRGKRYWCGLDGCYKVSAMQWFTEKVRPPPFSFLFPQQEKYVWANITPGQLLGRSSVGNLLQLDRPRRKGPHQDRKARHLRLRHRRTPAPLP